MKTYLLAINTASIVDTASTIWLASKFGWGGEANPVIRWYFQRLGVWPATAIKIGGAFFLSALLWQACKEARVTWIAWLWFLVFAFVAAFNVGGIIALY